MEGGGETKREGAIFNPPNEFHISHSATALPAVLNYRATRNETLQRKGAVCLFRRVKIGHKEARGPFVVRQSVGGEGAT